MFTCAATGQDLCKRGVAHALALAGREDADVYDESMTAGGQS